MMKTYALHEPAAFLIDNDVAATIYFANLLKNDSDEIDPAYLAKLQANGVYKTILTGEIPNFHATDARDIQIAMETLEDAGINDFCFASEFEGSADTVVDNQNPDDLDPDQAKNWYFDDDFMACIIPDRPISMFHAAYDSPDDMVEEFKAKLLPFLGPDFPYRQYICKIVGTYYC